MKKNTTFLVTDVRTSHLANVNKTSIMPPVFAGARTLQNWQTLTGYDGHHICWTYHALFIKVKMHVARLKKLKFQ